MNDFENFHAHNPEVLRLFIRFALEAKNAGASRFGAKACAERIRWEVAISTNGPDFKLNNNHVAAYARLAMDAEPALRGFFRTRDRKGQISLAL